MMAASAGVAGLIWYMPAKYKAVFPITLDHLSFEDAAKGVLSKVRGAEPRFATSILQDFHFRSPLKARFTSV